MSIQTFFDRGVIERAAKSMLDSKALGSGEGLSRELAVAIGWTEKTDSQIRAAFQEAARKTRGA